MAIKNPDGTLYTPHFRPQPTLALAIVRAWDERRYRTRLLADEAEIPLENSTAASSYTKTKSALREIGLNIDQPVVMTLAQYQYDPPYMRAEGEVVFVLPEEIGENVHTLPSADIAMALTPCGM